jgi:carboxyl-terminal processing protease
VKHKQIQRARTAKQYLEDSNRGYKDFASNSSNQFHPQSAMPLRLKSWQKLTRISLTIALVLVAAAPSPAALKDSPKALVDQAWQIIQHNYVDRSFNKQDWIAVRSRFLQPSYPTTATAYSAIETMMGSLGDPYTRFLTPEALKELTQNVSGDFVGVGLTVSLDSTSREWVVEKAFDESPAAIAGLKPQDIVVSLNGKPTPTIDPSKAGPYLVGAVGSKIAVQVRRGKEMLSYTLVREHINLNPLTYQTITSKAGKIGYIRLPIFTTKSPSSMQATLKTLESQQVAGYILDLRNNPGGVLDAGIAISRMWLPEGTIVSVKERNNPQEIVSANHQALTTKPLVVLINNQSASASEVLGAALQDNKRAILVGTNTFGKGLVQSFEPLNDSSGVLVTIAKYFTPKGQNIHKVGIKPNVTMEAAAEQPLMGDNDRQYQTALETLTQTIGQSVSSASPSK